MGFQIGFALIFIPLVLHLQSVYTILTPRKRRRCRLTRLSDARVRADDKRNWFIPIIDSTIRSGPLLQRRPPQRAVCKAQCLLYGICQTK
jgi:hypothetical protein